MTLSGWEIIIVTCCLFQQIAIKILLNLCLYTINSTYFFAYVSILFQPSVPSFTSTPLPISLSPSSSNSKVGGKVKSARSTSHYTQRDRGDSEVCENFFILWCGLFFVSKINSCLKSSQIFQYYCFRLYCSVLISVESSVF